MYTHHTHPPTLPFSGAQVDFEGTNMSTPLHEAAEAGQIDCVRLLLQRKADPMRKNKQHQTAYELAFNNRHHTVMEVIGEVLPSNLRPYSQGQSTILPSYQVVSSLCFLPGANDRLISGAQDCVVSCGERERERELLSRRHISTHSLSSGVLKKTASVQSMRPEYLTQCSVFPAIPTMLPWEPPQSS